MTASIIDRSDQQQTWWARVASAAVVLTLLVSTPDLCAKPLAASNATVDVIPASGLAVLAPTEAAEFTVGSVLAIEWTVNFARVTNGVNFQISRNNGGFWLPLDAQLAGTVQRSDTNYHGTFRGVFHWVIQDSLLNEMRSRKYSLVSDSCMLKVYSPYDLDSSTFGNFEAVSARFAIRGSAHALPRVAFGPMRSEAPPMRIVNMGVGVVRTAAPCFLLSGARVDRDGQRFGTGGIFVVVPRWYAR